MHVPFPRASRRLLPRARPYSDAYLALELSLVALLAVQGARLIYAVVTPVGPIGAWQSPPVTEAGPAVSHVLGSFDPFFRLTEDHGPAVVTSLDLQLFGVREDRATGRGSAIIATPDGNQQSFTVGDEIMPGVVLTAVGFDSVTISRGGAEEQIYLDQSTPVLPAQVPDAPDPPAAAPPAPPAPASAVQPVQNGTAR